MPKRVAVLGGGVAGLTAADELSQRGFAVHLFERDPAILGGKAASYDLPGSGEEERRDLPAEHGFRFFPGFYLNTFATMEGIPSRGGGTVDQHLVTADGVRFSFPGVDVGQFKSPVSWVGLARRIVKEKIDIIENWLLRSRVNDPQLFTLQDVDFVLKLFFSIDHLDLAALDDVIFEDFVLTEFPRQFDVDPPSEHLATFIRSGATRILVAAQPRTMSARTGLVTVRRLVDFDGILGERVDRLLAGPTNEMWIEPWRDKLSDAKVEIHLGCTVDAISIRDDRVDEILVDDGIRTQSMSFDHVICALPHKVLDSLLAGSGSASPRVRKVCDGLAQLRTDWMTGVQYYLNEPVDLVRGHCVYVGSPWALTSVCQAQFWDQLDLSDYGDGSIRDVLSVCVSDWDTPGLVHTRPAKECTVEQIREEVWHQMERSLNDFETSNLPGLDGAVSHFAIDRAITFDAAGVPRGNNAELFVNTVGSWRHRPPADIGMENFILAGDYVRTNADLATMESAIEAGRRAVRALLRIDGHPDAADPGLVRRFDNLGLADSP